MTRAEARKALLAIAHEAETKAARTHWRSRPMFSLISTFARSESKRAEPWQMPEIIAGHRRLWAAGLMIERRAER